MCTVLLLRHTPSHILPALLRHRATHSLLCALSLWSVAGPLAQLKHEQPLRDALCDAADSALAQAEAAPKCRSLPDTIQRPKVSRVIPHSLHSVPPTPDVMLLLTRAGSSCEEQVGTSLLKVIDIPVHGALTCQLPCWRFMLHARLPAETHCLTCHECV